MTTNDDAGKPDLADNPGLEHDHATEEGALTSATGSRIRDPRGVVEDVTLDDDPGLEHDEATEAGLKMTASGSTSSEAEHTSEDPPSES